MAYGLPDNLWIGLLVMAVIILALLWKDKVSKSTGGTGTETTPDAPSFDSIEHRPVNPDPGEEVNFKADFTANASISTYWFKVDGRKRDTTNTGSSLKTGPLTFEEGNYSYKAYVKDENGKPDSIGSSFSVNSGRTLEGPELKIKEEWGDEIVTLVARAQPRSADEIEMTEIAVDGVGESENRGPEARIELPAEPGAEYSYKAETVDSNDLTAEVEGELIVPRNPSPLSVKANYKIMDPVEGNVRIWAEVTEYSHEIEKVRIEFKPEEAGEDDWTWNDEEEQIRSEINTENTTNLHDGIYEVRATARDVENNRVTDSTTFTIGQEGGGGSRDEYPELVRVINQFSSNDFGSMGGFQGDQEVMAILEQILEQVDSSGSEGETRRVGMDAYQLLFALNALGVDLDGDDTQDIVNELRMIRQEMDTGGMSGDELENSLRTVLHDVFGQDLQSVIEGLELEAGFDEEAIVEALESRDIDLSQVTDRLDNIEQAVQEIEAQGGDMSDVEQKLDDIESAVRELQVDDQIFQDLTGEIQALRNEGIQVNVDMNDPLIIKLVEDIQHSGNPRAERRRILQTIRREGVITRRLLIQLLGEDATDPDESGGEGNKNEQTDLMDMSELDDDVAQEVKDLKQAHDQMKEVVRLTQQIERAESEIDDDIEHIINDLKKARKYDNLIMKYENDELSWTQFKQQLQDMGHEGGLGELKGIIEDARHALEDYLNDVGSFQKEVANLEEFAERHREHVEKVSENSQSMRDTIEILDSLKQEIRRDSDRKLSELR